MCKITTTPAGSKHYFYIVYNGDKYVLGTVTLRTAERTAHMMVRDYIRMKWNRNTANVQSEAVVMAGKKKYASIYAYKKGKGMAATILHL